MVTQQTEATWLSRDPSGVINMHLKTLSFVEQTCSYSDTFQLVNKNRTVSIN